MILYEKNRRAEWRRLLVLIIKSHEKFAMARYPSHYLICLEHLQAGSEEGQGDAFANHSEMLMGEWTRRKLAKIAKEWGQLARFN